MKRNLASLVLVILALTTAAWTPPAATCFGCTAAQKKECFDESERWYQECVDFYGQSSGNWCYEESNKREAACLIVKGCPQPVRNP
jgi:hypothetical protein